MKRNVLLTSFLSLCFFSFSQKHEALFDFFFKPAKQGAYYYVVTEKTDSGWRRTAYYLSQRTLAMQGLYKDEEGKVAQGDFLWYHTSRFLKSKGRYENGKKEGTWLGYNEEGILIDSSNYKNGRLVGTNLKWHANGYPSDSLRFDGQGNGTQVTWHNDGSLAGAGYWTQDTLKAGRWKFYYPSGQLQATRDYVGGKEINCACWNDTGTQLDTSLCREREAEVDAPAWRRFLESHLQRVIDKAARVLKPGQYTLAVRFLVDKEGVVTEVKPLTNYGQGIEEAVVAILKRRRDGRRGRCTASRCGLTTRSPLRLLSRSNKPVAVCLRHGGTQRISNRVTAEGNRKRVNPKAKNKRP